MPSETRGQAQRQAAADALRDAGEVVITSHERPDGDALGSCLALRRLLAGANRRARVVGMHPLPPRYAFLPAPGEVQAADGDWLAGAGLLVVMDCGAFDRPGEFVLRARKRVKVLNIDHHDSNTRFGDIDWVDPTASSTGEMVLALADACGWGLTPEVAEPLWVALATDTGRFVYENTSAATMRLAGRLLEAGAQPYRLYREIYLSLSLRELRLQERAMASLRVCEGGKLAYVSLSRRDFRELECGPQHAQDIVDLARSLRGVEVGIFFYELPDRDLTKTSVRADHPRDAVELCRVFGGGGHHRAAGCTLPGGLDTTIPRVLAKAHELWYGGAR